MYYSKSQTQIQQVKLVMEGSHSGSTQVQGKQPITYTVYTRRGTSSQIECEIYFEETDKLTHLKKLTVGTKHFITHI